VTPIHGRKSNFEYTPGTQVDFECDPDFILIGERTRVCQANGEWNIPTKGPVDGRTETEWLNWNLAKTTRCIGKDFWLTFLALVDRCFVHICCIVYVLL